MFDIEDIPQELFDKKNATLLTGILRGVEREALRTSKDGLLAQTPHPSALGSALTHPQITTDFSESLLEFITPPTHRVDDLFAHLEAIQKYTVSQLKEEILWTASMPCVLPDDSEIPVALYGNSNNGKMKTIYRIGLGHRYGRKMQTVSGVHYNFSLPNAFWAFLSNRENSLSDLQAFKNQKYFSLIRNFRRHYWLLVYLFGASPALCKSFVAGKNHQLDEFEDSFSLFKPYATSLRMGDLGYQSKAQEALYICYNNIESYIKSLCCAITRPYEEYASLGLKDDLGNYQQLNTSILQIENEFYSSIRPKRTAQPGETAISALQNRGVEYIEVRCLDIDPFTELGISQDQVRFLDTFLLYCALKESADTNQDEANLVLSNQKLVVNQGRDPNTKLKMQNNSSISISEWGANLLNAMEPVAKLLDTAENTEYHQQALALQKKKVTDHTKTPSAKILELMKERNTSFKDLMLNQSLEFFDKAKSESLDNIVFERMEAMATESQAEQTALEQTSVSSFAEFLSKYYAQYNQCS